MHSISWLLDQNGRDATCFAPTMPKRPHIVEDADEEVATPSSKRARNTESSSGSEDEQGPSQTQTRARPERAQAKGKGRTQEEDDIEDEERDKSKDEEMDDEQFENVYGEKLRVRLEEKRRTQGVSFLVNWMWYNTYNPFFLGRYSCSWSRYYRIHRDASIHVPQIPHLYIWPTD